MGSIQQTKDWLKTQEDGIYMKSHKAAIIRSSDPFGLFGSYKDASGVEYNYINGKIESIDYEGETVRYKQT